MKKILLTVISVLTLSATAVAQNAAAIEGDYSGKLIISIGEPITEESDAIEGYEVELTIGENDNAINLALYDFALNDLMLGDIKLNNIGVESKGNDVYHFQKNPDVALILADGMIEATASLNHETSFVEGDSLVADINVMWTNTDPKTPIYVKFLGHKLYEMEQPVVGSVKDIIGTYNGDLFIQLEEPISDNSDALPNHTVEISAGAKDGFINLALYNFSLGDLKLGDIKLNNIRVMPAGSNTYFFIPGPEENITLGEGDTMIEATVSLNPETSCIKDGVLTADIDVMWTNTDPETPIYVRFVSKTMTGIESLVAAPAKKGTYTLSGVRVNSDNLPAGIYIVNGKKVLVK